MLNILKISIQLKNTYRTNAIIYSLKQVPLIKKVLPETLYGVGGLKTFSSVISILWEMINMFLWKFLYFVFLFASLELLEALDSASFLFIFTALTFGGAIINTYMFDPSKDKYYAIVLMRIDARKFTLVNYYYQLFRLVLGLLPFTLLLHFFLKISLWVSILLPFFVLFVKASWQSFELTRFRKSGVVDNENQLGWLKWCVSIGLLLLSYFLVWQGYSLNSTVFLGIFVLFFVLGSYGLWKGHHFDSYSQMQKKLLTTEVVYATSKENISRMNQENMKKRIDYDQRITSDKEGFSYFHELFVQRHRKIFLRTVQRQAIVIFILFIVTVIAIQLNSSFSSFINEFLLQYLPYIVFVSYLMNRGMPLTQAMYMNCDYSMLTYRIYRTPSVILGLFKERLKTLALLNLIPASVLAVGFPILLWLTGGTANYMNYILLFASVLALSVFFSVHYLVMYYLLQPYNKKTEMKNPLYSLVQWLTYFVSYFLIGKTFSTLSFGVATVLFSIVYVFLSLVIVYKLAPRTFKIRS